MFSIAVKALIQGLVDEKIDQLTKENKKAPKPEIIRGEICKLYFGYNDDSGFYKNADFLDQLLEKKLTSRQKKSIKKFLINVETCCTELEKEENTSKMIKMYVVTVNSFLNPLKTIIGVESLRELENFDLKNQAAFTNFHNLFIPSTLSHRDRSKSLSDLKAPKKKPPSTTTKKRSSSSELWTPSGDEKNSTWVLNNGGTLETPHLKR